MTDLSRLQDLNPLIEVTSIKDGEELVAGKLSIKTDATGIIVQGGAQKTLSFAGITDPTTGVFEASFDIESLGSAVSNIEVVPLPAAAWMMIGGLGMIGGAVARNRRKARADA